MSLTENIPIADATTCCAPLVQETMTADQALGLAASLRALAEPARLRLLSTIAAHKGAEACVCDLTGPLGLSQPTVSHHLKILVESGFLSRSKRGTWAYYRLVPGSLDAVAHLLRTAWPADTGERTTGHTTNGTSALRAGG